VNGRISPEAEAVIPVMDRSFLFGDSVYETLRTHGGVPFAFGEHLARLRASAARVAITVPLSDDGLAARIKETIAAAGPGAERYIRVILTRGTATAPNIDVAFAPKDPNLVLLVRDLDPGPPDLFEQGVAAAVVSTLRNDPRALDPAIKSGNYLNNIMGLLEARKRGAREAIFLNTEGQVTEAPTANLYMAAGGEAFTPPLSIGILAGVTRGILLELARAHGLPLSERSFDVAQLRAADEVFLSSTLRGVVPITTLDGRPVDGGRPGPIARLLQEHYTARVEATLGPMRRWWDSVGT
jgi:branched-chain amino acid aminotransferase